MILFSLMLYRQKLLALQVTQLMKFENIETSLSKTITNKLYSNLLKTDFNCMLMEF